MINSTIILFLEYLSPDFFASFIIACFVVLDKLAIDSIISSSNPIETVQLAFVADEIFTLVVVATPHPVRANPNTKMHMVSSRCFKCLFIIIVTSLFKNII